jgi:hypothetical protein
MLSVLERAVFGVVLTGGFALAAFMLVAPDAPPAASTTAKAHVATFAPAAQRSRSSPVRKERVRRRSPALTTAVVVAARGSSWLELRAGSAIGRTLYARVLAEGQRVTFKAKKIWLRAGAASYLDITVNGKPLTPSLFGTAEVVLPSVGA